MMEIGMLILGWGMGFVTWFLALLPAPDWMVIPYAWIVVVYLAAFLPFRAALVLSMLMTMPFFDLSALVAMEQMLAVIFLLLAVSLAKKRLYGEAYLTLALWVAVIIFLGQALLALVAVKFDMLLWARFLMRLLAGSLWAGVISLPVFYVLDLWRDRFSRKSQLSY